MKNIYEERAEKAEAARDDARRKYKQAKELAQKFDDVIDDLKCAVSCINPLEDLKRAILALKERAEKAEAQLAERDAEIARLRADARFREETTPACWCETCRPIKMGKDMRMVLCPECGNKRCPRATNHIYQCTARKDAK